MSLKIIFVYLYEQVAKKHVQHYFARKYKFKKNRCNFTFTITLVGIYFSVCVRTRMRCWWWAVRACAVHSRLVALDLRCGDLTMRIVPKETELQILIHLIVTSKSDDWKQHVLQYGISQIVCSIPIRNIYFQLLVYFGSLFNNKEQMCI